MELSAHLPHLAEDLARVDGAPARQEGRALGHDVLDPLGQGQREDCSGVRFLLVFPSVTTTASKGSLVAWGSCDCSTTFPPPSALESLIG